MNASATKRVLILGGTHEAITLASALDQYPSFKIITSLAGRTQNPVNPVGQVRVGGFGGTAGLTDYLQDQCIQALIDATHPFADQISWHGVAAAAATHIPHLLLIRPPWEKGEGDRWIEVPNHAAAAATVSDLARRVFLTIGRQELSAYVTLDNLWFLMRMIDPPAVENPIPQGKILLARGPFTLQEERSLLLAHHIDTIISKNSGGAATYAKLIAARELNLPVVMVQRPPMPVTEQVYTVSEAVHWLLRQLG